MALHEQIKKDVREAMIKKDEVRVTVLRSLLAAFTNELIAKKAKSDAMLSDDDALTLIKRSANQHKDSIAQFDKGGRTDLSAAERTELEVLESYLPALMSVEEIRKIAKKKLAELGALDKSKLGMFVGTLMKELKGKADGADVKAVCEELLS
jgi:uncharacterized protein YqeY